jgi:hypothetical protein
LLFQDIFSGIETEADEDFELDALASDLKSKGGKVLGQDKEDDKEYDSDDESDGASSVASDYEMPQVPKKRTNEEMDSSSKKASKNGGFEVVPKDGK